MPREQPGQIEREKTDQSLRVERARTDEELDARLAAIDDAADALVAKARSRADLAIARGRESADRAAAPATPGSTAALARNRAGEDRARDAERATSDEALSATRAQQNPERHAEREDTDRDLSHERARADELVSVRDMFLGIVSHDLRNLLNGLLGFSKLMAKESAGDGPNERVAQHARRIERMGARMNRLVGDLVDVASIEAGVLAVRREVGDPAAVVAEAVADFEAHGEALGLTLETAIGAPLPPVTFDSPRILQVLCNLLSNALKFTPRGGRVVVGVEASGADLLFSVSDTGAGVPRDRLEAIFGSFVQLGEDDRRGVGLGLYISRCIVEGHGGRIRADSTMGKGSTFRFTIPPEGAARLAPASSNAPAR